MAVWRDRRAGLGLALMSRRFPPPWSVDEPDSKLDRRCLIVRDGNGQALAYVYFRGGAGTRFGHFQTRRSGRLRLGQQFHVAKPVAVPSCQLTSVVAAKVLFDPLIPLYFPVPPVYSKVPVQCTVSPSHFQVT